MNTPTKWSIDPTHSEIAFKVKHMMIANVKGTFRKFESTIVTTGTDFTTAEIDFRIDPCSIDTRDEKRDEHLRSADFFDAENHKEISFTSSTISKPDKDGNHELWGELTLKGISKTIKLNVVFGGIIMDPWGNERAGFNVGGKINRKDWDLTWNNSLLAGGFMVGDEIFITCEIQLIKSTIEVEAMMLDAVATEK